MIASWEDRTGAITLYSSTQVPNGVKTNLQIALGLPENGVRVIAPDLGSGFASSSGSTRGDPALLDRAEAQAPGEVDRGPLGTLSPAPTGASSSTTSRSADDDGRILAIRDDCLTNTGAYLQSLTLVEPSSSA